MGKSWALCALMALASLSSARSLCDDVQSYLNVPVPLGGDMEIDLVVASVECPPNGELPDELDEVIVQGGTLTITSTQSSVQFVNLRFRVEDGASLVFDVDTVLFGPNSGYEENAQGFMIDVKEGGSVTFLGDFEGTEVRNVRSMFFNAGTMDFKGRARFERNGNVFRSNSGDLKFRGKTTFKDNWYLAIDNIDSGYVRFSVRSSFTRNAKFFDGGSGCAISNNSMQGRLIFRGDATFREHSCEGPGAISSSGDVKFYGKAYFIDNSSSGDNGGAVRNIMGSMIFKAAAQFINNVADSGGGLAVEGGDVTFNKAVKFDGNTARETGGAFSVTYGTRFEDGVTTSGDGSLTFKKPAVVKAEGNALTPLDDTELPFSLCDFGYVEDGSTVVGFTADDGCVEA